MRKASRIHRLFVKAAFLEGGEIETNRGQANYLRTVLRMRRGERLLVFNGMDGEWWAEVVSEDRKAFRLRLIGQERPQTPVPDLHYLFAPLKQARQDYMVQKAVEMGVSLLCPTLTQHCQVSRVNGERLEANIIEAAQQCGVLSLPGFNDIASLEQRLADWDDQRALVFCDEGAGRASPIEALTAIEPGPLALLIGPEGGFSVQERELVSSLPFVTTISLGPRILRADTAATAALACIQATIGDWH